MNPCNRLAAAAIAVLAAFPTITASAHLSATPGRAPITLMFSQGAAPAADPRHCRFR